MDPPVGKEPLEVYGVSTRKVAYNDVCAVIDGMRYFMKRGSCLVGLHPHDLEMDKKPLDREPADSSIEKMCEFLGTLRLGNTPDMSTYIKHVFRTLNQFPDLLMKARHRLSLKKRLADLDLRDAEVKRRRSRGSTAGSEPSHMPEDSD